MILRGALTMRAYTPFTCAAFRASKVGSTLLTPLFYHCWYPRSGLNPGTGPGITVYSTPPPPPPPILCPPVKIN